ncbi:CaiB/BaiF CoA transferase family protein [Pseudomonas sp. 5P_3.1_Bac2]|uniref:CaiB/BaiF CoA transferase family protein n=1 Tax=Pseudomonas sp. 5P_3.1_Bac2 TaxID=2971617 RepID=UPI0021CA47F3|nr:CaiB/BaiF CoA-transferase family protein [Pseudomonas sp. 5P_3.1_Bac2]MCU1719462.1 CoA transferase [Pseudomonas sp. 5P_3.1_Bac2]
MSIQTGALAGIKVLDLSRVLGGPYCTQALADHGAQVIKLEPLRGDETRGWGPPFVGDTAAYYRGVNRNKQGIAVDLSQPAGQEVFLRLLSEADVLVENFKPGTLQRWGLGYNEVLREKFPRLVHCCVSGFGEQGPLGGLPGYDAAIQAMAGLMSVNGSHHSGPMRVGLPIVDMVTGLNAMNGILLALQERERSGRGQFVDITLYDCAVSLLHPHVPNYLASGHEPVLTGNAHPNIAPYDCYQTGGEPVYLAVGNDNQFAILCQHIGAPDMPQDGRFANNRERSVHRQVLKYELELHLAKQLDAQQLVTALINKGVPCGVISSVKQVINHPHTQFRQMIQQLGDYQGIASPIKLSRTPAQYRLVPPALGEHTVAVLQAHGYSAEDIAALAEQAVINR